MIRQAIVADMFYPAGRARAAAAIIETDRLFITRREATAPATVSGAPPTGDGPVTR